MAYDIAGALRDPTQDLDNGYKLGQSLVQTQQQGQLARLASQAMGQYGDQRQQTLQQAASLDPETAMKLHDQLMQGDQNYVNKAVGAARYVLSATKTGNPQDAENAFQAVKPTMDKYAQITGHPFPDHFDPSMIPAMEGLVSSAGQMGKVHSVVMDAQGNYKSIDDYGNSKDLGINGMPKGAGLKTVPIYGQDKNGNVVQEEGTMMPDGSIYHPDGTLYRGPLRTFGQPGPQGQAQPQGVGANTGAMLNSAYQNAIAGIESKGSGDYAAVGPATKTGDRAYGKYQVMGANIPQWTLAALGKSMSPQEFLANPQAQDAVFNNQFGQYVQKYGPEGAARAWFGGPGNVNNPNAKDVNGMSVGQYGQKFAQGMSPQGQDSGQPDANGITWGTRPIANKNQSQSTKIQQDISDFEKANGVQVTPQQRLEWTATGKAPASVYQGNGDANDSLYSTLTPNQKELVKMVVERRMDNSTWSRIPAKDKSVVLAATNETDPTINFQNIDQAAKYRAGLAKSDPNSTGGQINSYNAAFGHLGELVKANADLNNAGMNSDYQFINRAKGYVSGQSGNSAITAWNQAANLFSEELGKLVKGGVASEGEVENLKQGFAAAQSPQQRNKALVSAVNFMLARTNQAETAKADNLGQLDRGNSVLTASSQDVARRVLVNLGHEEDPKFLPANDGKGYLRDLRGDFPKLYGGKTTQPFQPQPSGGKNFSNLWGQ